MESYGKFRLLKKRLRSFWAEFKRTKKGLIGLSIIIFYGIVATVGASLTPHDPLRPVHKGYYPASQPPLAEKLVVPAWYKMLPGGENLSENMEIVMDHEFSSPENFKEEWNVRYNENLPIKVQYNPTAGSHDYDGCVEISYKSGRSDRAGITVSLIKKFYYPYNMPPKSFWMHLSVFVDNRTGTLKKCAVEYIFVRDGKSFIANRFVVRTTHTWNHLWAVSEGIKGTIEEEIFPRSGNYSFIVNVKFEVEDEADLSIYLDNINVLLYGYAFGLLGTDRNEATPRDLFTTLIHGTRVSFLVGFLTAILGVSIGLVVGLIAGYCRGVVDEVLMRIADLLLVLPGLPLLIVLAVMLGRSIWNIIGILAFMGWMGFSRNVRSMVLSLRERPFVEAAKAAGGGTFYIIRKHILPNVFALVYISLATSVPGAIIAEASLSWLGLGDINVPSWGMMLYEFSRSQVAIAKGVSEYWFWVIPPGIAITLFAMAFILLGYSLDEILNPRLRLRR